VKRPVYSEPDITRSFALNQVKRPVYLPDITSCWFACCAPALSDKTTVSISAFAGSLVARLR